MRRMFFVTRGQRTLLFLILAVSALAYAPALRFGFVYDDFPQIVNNPRIAAWRELPGYFSHNLWAQSQSHGEYYRPFFLIWLRSLRVLFGSVSAGWHASSILLHLLATWCIFIFAREFFRRLNVFSQGLARNDDGADRASRAALVATGFFAFHPVHAETVAWLSAANDLLLTIFCALSLYLYLGARSGTPAANAHHSKNLTASLLFFAAGLLTKEPAAVLPGIILLLDAAIPSSQSEPSHTARNAFMRVLPYLIVLAGYLGLRRWALGPNAAPRFLFSPSTYFLTWPDQLWFYVRKMFAPLPVSEFYDAPYVSAPTRDFWLPLACLAILLIYFAIIRLKPRRPSAALALAFLLPLLPTFYFGLFPFHDFLHDRYTYLPSVFACMLFALVLEVNFSHSAYARNFYLTASVLLMAAGAAATSSAIAPFHDDLSLYRQGVTVAPRFGDIARIGLANALEQRGDFTSALEQLRVLQLRHPESWVVQSNTGQVLFNMGRFAEAEDAYAAALKTKPAGSQAPELMMLGFARLRQGRAAEAEAPLREAAAGGEPQYVYALSLCLKQEGKNADEQQLLAPLAGRDPRIDARLSELRNLDRRAASPVH